MKNINEMNMEQKIARINELYNNSKNTPLNEEELAEQKLLRRAYIDNIKGSLAGHLNNISIKEEDGTITPLKPKNKK